jgi:hypothetical protein
MNASKLPWNMYRILKLHKWLIDSVPIRHVPAIREVLLAFKITHVWNEYHHYFTCMVVSGFGAGYSPGQYTIVVGLYTII